MADDKRHDEVGWAYGVRSDDLHDCGCGQPEARLELVRQILRDCPLYAANRGRKYDTPAAEWVLCLLDEAELTEHGSSIGGSWITEKGQRFLTVLEDAEAWATLNDCTAPVGYCECAECDRR